MAFGDDPLGSVPIGQPGPTTEIPDVQTRQKALFFDVATRDYPIDEDTGRYAETDQATAACQNALFFLKKKIPSSPTTGNTLDEVDPFGPRAQADTDTRIRTALDPVARRGWIRDIQVRMQPVASGGMKVEVSVYNTLLGERKPVFDGVV